MSFASADPVRTSTSPEVVPIKVDRPGDPIRWELSDGREITLFVERNAPTTLDLPLQIGANTCRDNPERAPKCRLKLPSMLVRFEARWTKNSDPARLNKVVRTKGVEPIADLRINHFPGVYHSTHFPTEHAGLSRLELVCNDFSWLAGMHEAPAQMDFLSWSSEFMIPNPETGANENMTVAGVYDLHFTRSASDRLQLQTTGDWFGIDVSLVPDAFISGDVQHLLTEDGRGGICQSSVKPALVAYFTDREKYTSSRPGDFQPYISGSDLFFEMGAGFIDNVLKFSEDGLE